MVRKINTIFIPSFGINDSVIGHWEVKFPEIETTDEKLCEIKNILISNNVATRGDFIRYKDNNDPDKYFGTPIQTLQAPSFMCAIAWFNKLTNNR